MTIPTSTPSPAVNKLAKFAAVKASYDVGEGPVPQSDFADLGLDQAVFKRFDANGDGKVVRAEFATRLARLSDADQQAMQALASRRHYAKLPLFAGVLALPALLMPGVFPFATAVGVAGVALVVTGLVMMTVLDNPKKTLAPFLAKVGVATEAEAASEAAAAARVAPTKAGLTERADLLMSKGPLSITDLGTDRMAVAEAKASARGTDRETIIVQSGERYVRVDSLAFSVVTGDLPKVGETIAFNGPKGEKVEGRILFQALQPPPAPKAPPAPAARRQAPAPAQESAEEQFYRYQLQKQRAEDTVKAVDLMFQAGKEVYKQAGFR